MNEITTWSFTEEQLSDFMQQVKSVILYDLKINDLITEETYKDYTITKFIVIRKPSFFTKLWKNIFSYEEDNNYLVLCTAESLDFKKEIEPEKKTELKVVPITDKQKNSE
jgi:hypothetical protein